MEFYSYDFKQLASELATTLENTFKVGDLTVVFLLREIYGENQIFEVINRSKEESFTLSLFELLKILQNWSEVKEYPLDWSLSI